MTIGKAHTPINNHNNCLMKNLITLALLTLIVNFVFAQSEKDINKSVAAEFEKNYNTETLMPSSLCFQVICKKHYRWIRRKVF